MTACQTQNIFEHRQAFKECQCFKVKDQATALYVKTTKPEIFLMKQRLQEKEKLRKRLHTLAL